MNKIEYKTERILIEKHYKNVEYYEQYKPINTYGCIDAGHIASTRFVQAIWKVILRNRMETILNIFKKNKEQDFTKSNITF